VSTDANHEAAVGAADADRILRAALDVALGAIDAEARDPVLAPTTGDALRAMIDAPPPREGAPLDTVMDEVRRLVVAPARRNGHRGFFAYVGSPADAAGIAGDLIASALNQNVTAWRSAPSATEIERLVLRWLDDLLGFNGAGHGVFTSGGSGANMTALAAAMLRAERDDPDRTRDRMTIYRSAEAHFSLDKAARILGVRADHVRAIAIDERRAMRPGALADAIDADRRAGLTPVLVCATAGTTNTGAIDPTPDIAPVARERGVWLHVDGAYGAPAALGARGAELRDHFALADSLAVDPHKWLFTPIDIGCVLFRDEAAQFEAFTTTSDYVEVHQTAPIERFAFFDRGVELSRRFRALKLWLLLRLRGADAIAREIDRHIALRERLDERIAEAPTLERIAGGLSIVCFRVRPPGASDREADGATTRALERINATGRFLLSPTKVDGRPALRACIVGFRTEEKDIDGLAALAAADG